MFSTLRRWRRRYAAKRYKVAPELWARVEASLPFLDFLPGEARTRLRGLALEFLAEKQLSGARGLELNDAMRLAIALQACLPILARGLDAYDDWVGVVVYPGDFVVPRRITDAAGVVHEYDEELLGEAWQRGPVLLSWHGDPDESGGANVVIHEFAHKLDMRNGPPDGMPDLPEGMSRKHWADAFTTAYEDFCTRVDAGEDTPLDPYGATHPAEFFAVMSEAFFETPLVLRDEYPQVYVQLARFYAIDTAAGSERLHSAAA